MFVGLGRATAAASEDTIVNIVFRRHTRGANSEFCKLEWRTILRRLSLRLHYLTCCELNGAVLFRVQEQKFLQIGRGWGIARHCRVGGEKQCIFKVMLLSVRLACEIRNRVTMAT